MPWVTLEKAMAAIAACVIGDNSKSTWHFKLHIVCQLWYKSVETTMPFNLASKIALEIEV
jgi:hypothetical protein